LHDQMFRPNSPGRLPVAASRSSGSRPMSDWSGSFGGPELAPRRLLSIGGGHNRFYNLNI